MPDAIFDDPRLAEVYDPLEPDRRDLDVGCGTGTFACMLARRGVKVTADPGGPAVLARRAG